MRPPQPPFGTFSSTYNDTHTLNKVNTFFSAVCLSKEAEAAAVADNSAGKMLLNCERQKTVAVCLCERLSNTKDGKSKFSLVCSDDEVFIAEEAQRRRSTISGLFCFASVSATLLRCYCSLN